MMVQDAWEAIISGTRQDPAARAMRTGLAPASGLYGIGLATNHWIYDGGLKEQTRAPMPVISIGNLTLGGTGKTTSAAYVARLVMGIAKPGIVLRGYRRKASEGPLIVSDGRSVLADQARSGDEAVMLARMLPGCVVAVGKRREQVIAAMKDKTDAQVAILDDGLQYFRMFRDVEIVLIDALQEPAGLRLFPAGRLREPLANLRRADQVWITHSDLVGPERLAALEACVRNNCPDGLVAHARHRTGELRSLDARATPDSLDGLRVLAFSGLGNPEAFERSLARQGAAVHSIRFPDHHAYTEDDLSLVQSRANSAGADIIVTTAKDAVKLPGPVSGAVPCAVLECELELTSGAEAVADQIKGVCNV